MQLEIARAKQRYANTSLTMQEMCVWSSRMMEIKLPLASAPPSTSQDSSKPLKPTNPVTVLLFSNKLLVNPHSFIHSGYLYSAPSRNLLRGALSPATVKEKCLK